MGERLSFSNLLKFYENHLTKDIMPFWTTHCMDWEHGGINNIVDDDGTVQSTDKVLWSQGRTLWTFSALYNDFDQDPEWLRYADCMAELVMNHGRMADGSWAFRLSRDGSVLEGPKSIYVDAFMIMGFTEYARATGKQEPIELAIQTYKRTSPLLDDHTSFSTEPHPIPENLQSHGPYMIFALMYHELGLLTGDQEILGRGLELAEIVMTQHVKPEHELLFELVKPGGELADTDAGNTFLAGHAIESMWFMERIYRHYGRQERIALAMECMRWHLEKGWDEEFGGLFLACHRKGGAPRWHAPDCKCWWPHTEALYGLLRAYEVTGESWCMDWYWRVHDYAFAHFPLGPGAEWRHYLDREGNPIPCALKNLPVKDPFHLPRALIYSIETLRRLANGSRRILLSSGKECTS